MRYFKPLLDTHDGDHYGFMKLTVRLFRVPYYGGNCAPKFPVSLWASLLLFRQWTAATAALVFLFLSFFFQKRLNGVVSISLVCLSVGRSVGRWVCLFGCFRLWSSVILFVFLFRLGVDDRLTYRRSNDHRTEPTRTPSSALSEPRLRPWQQVSLIQ